MRPLATTVFPLMIRYTVVTGEYIVNNTFTYKVSLLLQSEFEPP